MSAEKYRQCYDCGEYFRSKGLAAHRRNCLGSPGREVVQNQQVFYHREQRSIFWAFLNPLNLIGAAVLLLLTAQVVEEGLIKFFLEPLAGQVIVAYDWALDKYEEKERQRTAEKKNKRKKAAAATTVAKDAFWETFKNYQQWLRLREQE